MTSDTRTLIDSLTLFPHPTDTVSPHLTFCCPYGNDEVDPSFTAILNLGPGEVGVVWCRMYERDNPTHYVTGNSVRTMYPLFYYNFSGLMPGKYYDLKTQTSPFNSVQTQSDLLVESGGKTCTNAIFRPRPPDPGSGSQLKGVEFPRTPSVGGTVQSKPITLYGMVSADFIVGGPLVAGSAGPGFALFRKNTNNNEAHFALINNGLAEVDGLRWSLPCTNLPEGVYVVVVIFHTGQVASLQISIRPDPVVTCPQM